MNTPFIVIEGPDGAGTSTHSKRLIERLRAAGKDVLHTFEATDGPIGTSIREFLRNGKLPGSAIQTLFTADRAWHVDTVIKPALEKGQIVLCDRYALSTVIYGTAQGVDGQWLQAMNDHFIQPDLMILLLPPLDVCLQRLGLREMDTFEANGSLQQRVYNLYQKHAATMDPANLFDTSGDFEEVAAAIGNRIDSFLLERTATLIA